jgi:hypothetical protein
MCATGENLTLASGAKVKHKLLVGRVHATSMKIVFQKYTTRCLLLASFFLMSCDRY